MMINRDDATPSNTPGRAQTLIPVLGYAGLLPFLIALVARSQGVSLLGHAPEALFVSYSAVILSFLAGSLWGRAQYQPQDRLVWRLILLSNAIAVMVWITISATDAATSLLVLASGFALLWWLESRWDREMAPPYQRLRNRLTALVVVLHGLMFWA